MRKAPQITLGINGYVVSVDATSGDELWRTKLRSSQFVTIHQPGDRIFAGAAGELFCLDASDGRLLWHNKLKRMGLGVVCFAADVDAGETDLIIGIRGRVLSINASSGEENWRSEALGSGGASVTLLALTAGTIIAGHNGRLHCLDRRSGAVRWRNPLKGLGWGLVSLGGNETAIAHAIAQAHAAAAS